MVYANSKKLLFTIALLGSILGISSAIAADTITIKEQLITDFRPVIAKVEAGDKATARSRLQGVVTKITIDEGSIVKAGEVVAIVTDDTIPPKIAALNSRIEGLRSQVRQQQEDIARAESLIKDGFYPQAKLDEQHTNLEVLQRNLSSAQAEQRALIARKNEGTIKAPADSRVTSVNVVTGSIVSPGEVIASFSTLNGVVRISLPERHAGSISEGETVSLRLPSRNGEVKTAKITKIYPELRDGSLIADAVVEGGLSALVGERVDVLVSVGERRAILTPHEYISTRYGVDFVRVKVGDRFIDAPVALASSKPDTDGNYEVLTGLTPGDVIMKAGE
ncbi:MAG: efflux RND transporter periplasmic adaptor subunit [bacterium]